MDLRARSVESGAYPCYERRTEYYVSASRQITAVSLRPRDFAFDLALSQADFTSELPLFSALIAFQCDILIYPSVFPRLSRLDETPVYTSARSTSRREHRGRFYRADYNSRCRRARIPRAISIGQFRWRRGRALSALDGRLSSRVAEHGCEKVVLAASKRSPIIDVAQRDATRQLIIGPLFARNRADERNAYRLSIRAVIGARDRAAGGETRAERRYDSISRLICGRA